MNPHFIRAVLSVLIVRAIFISPALGSECAPASLASRSSLKRLDLIRPSRLRFPKPVVPSASQERLDCCEGGGGKRSRPAVASAEGRPFAPTSRTITAFPPIFPASSCPLVRLRC